MMSIWALARQTLRLVLLRRGLQPNERASWGAGRRSICAWPVFGNLDRIILSVRCYAGVVAHVTR